MTALLARLLDAWRATYDEALVVPIQRIGAQVAKTMIDQLLAQLAGGKFKQIAVCADGRARFELDWSLRNRSKKLATVDITFDGEMIDLTVPPSEQEITRTRES